MMGIFSVTVLCLLLGNLVWAGNTAAEDHGSGAGAEAVEQHDGADEHTHDGEAAHPKLKVLKGFGKYKSGLKALCYAADEDGRWEWLRDIVNLNAVEEEGCFACQSFFRVFSASCVFPKKILKAGEKPGVIVRNKQREPNVKVIDAASRTFHEISRNERDFTENYKAIQKLLYLLRNPRKKTEGEKEYFMILSQYVSAPFDESKYQAKLRQEAAALEEDHDGLGHTSHEGDAL